MLVRNKILKLLIEKFDNIVWEDEDSVFGSIPELNIQIRIYLQIRNIDINFLDTDIYIKDSTPGIDLELLEKFHSKFYLKFPEISTNYQSEITLLNLLESHVLDK